MQRSRKLVLMLLSMFLFPAMVSAETILGYTDHEPLEGMRTRCIKEIFFAAIAKESNGRLKIEEHWDSTLATGYDALRVVGDGRVADMATVVPEYSPKTLPLHQIFKSFPSGPDTGDKQLAFFRRVYAQIPAFPAELEKNNVVNIYFGIGYPVAFFSAKPLSALTDMKGETWRSASFWHQGFLRNAGVNPITMPWGEETLKALQSRTLDGIMVNLDGGSTIKVNEIAPHVLTSRALWLGHVYLLVMNKSTWNALGKDDQAAITRAAEIACKTSGTVLDSHFDTMVADMKKEGMTVRFLQDKEIADWSATTKYRQVQDAWVKEQQGKGVKGTGATLDKVRVILDEVMKQE